MIRRFDHPSRPFLECTDCRARQIVNRLHIFDLMKVAHDCELGTWELPAQLKPVRSR